MQNIDIENNRAAGRLGYPRCLPDLNLCAFAIAVDNHIGEQATNCQRTLSAKI